MPARSAKVNLVPPSEFESGFWGKFLKWAVTTGRYMIILTEMVVIVAFLMRFKLDEDLRNINEQINGQVGLLKSMSVGENKFRALQKKVNLASSMLDNRTQPTDGVIYLQERSLPEINTRKKEIMPKEIVFAAATLSDKAMGQFMASLSAEGTWASLDVTELVGDKESGIKFTIAAKK